MRASGILLVIAFCSTIASGRELPSLRSTSSHLEATAVVPAPFWFSPVIDLIKWVYNGAKLSGNDKQTANKSKSPMQSEAKTLQQLPPFLSAEIDFRTAAVNLIALAKLMDTYPSVADAEWERLKTSLKQTDDFFKNSYGSKDMTDMLQSNDTLEGASKDCQQALNDIDQGVANVAGSASAANKQLAIDKLSGDFNTLSGCSQKPETVVVVQLHNFLTSYQEASQSQGGQPQGTPKNGQNGVRLNTSKPTVVLASFQVTPETKQGSSVDVGTTTEKTAQAEPKYITDLQAKITQPVKLPDWMGDLAQAQSEVPKAPFKPWQTALEGIVGALGVGVYSIKLFPNFFLGILGLHSQAAPHDRGRPQPMSGS